jgi:hypothetical protein
MPDKLAIKRLTKSDLTFFEWHFTNRNAGNQKAINLNANIFIEILYPSLPEALGGRDRVPLDLYMYGPGLAGEYNLQRKIIKGRTYKNWRLNGEFVDNPGDDPDRFNVLRAGDYAIIDFIGELQPTGARVIFVAKNEPEDQQLHQAIVEFMGRSSMRPITIDELAHLINNAEPAEKHPIWDLTMDAEVEDAALGGIEGIRNLRRRPSSRTMSSQALESARQNAVRIGRTGEEFVNAHLMTLVSDGVIVDFEWTAAENAISPYDFEVETVEGVRVIDVKATGTNFENRLHISYNELLQMGRGEFPYDLYRVYRIDEDQDIACMRRASDLREFAEEILQALDQLPPSVSPDGVSVSPGVLDFDEEIILRINVDESDEDLEDLTEEE